MKPLQFCHIYISYVIHGLIIYHFYSSISCRFSLCDAVLSPFLQPLFKGSHRPSKLWSLHSDQIPPKNGHPPETFLGSQASRFTMWHRVEGEITLNPYDTRVLSLFFATGSWPGVALWTRKPRSVKLESLQVHLWLFPTRGTGCSRLGAHFVQLARGHPQWRKKYGKPLEKHLNSWRSKPWKGVISPLCLQPGLQNQQFAL